MIELVNNITHFPKQTDNKGAAIIYYMDGSSESILCDEFGASDSFPGFMVFFNNPSNIVCLIQTLSIKKIEVA